MLRAPTATGSIGLAFVGLLVLCGCDRKEREMLEINSVLYAVVDRCVHSGNPIEETRVCLAAAGFKPSYNQNAIPQRVGPRLLGQLIAPYDRFAYRASILVFYDVNDNTVTSLQAATAQPRPQAPPPPGFIDWLRNMWEHGRWN